MVSLLVLGAPVASGCSSDSDEPSGGGAGETGSGGASGGGGTTGTGGETATGGDAAGGGLGGMGTAEGEPKAPTCDGLKPVMAGGNYGEYSVYSVRLALGVEPGDYTVRVHSGDSGKAYVYRDDQFVASLPYQPDAMLTVGQSETIVFPDLFELDLRSGSLSDLGALDESIFDGCHVFSVTAAKVLEEAGVYGSYQLTALNVDPMAEAGTYTFFASTGNGGEVQLLRDGTVVHSLSYVWGTTVGNGETYEFVFPGVVSFTIGRVMGTSNLFGLADSLFDGRHELVIE